MIITILVKAALIAYFGFAIVADVHETRQIRKLFVDKGFPQHAGCCDRLSRVSVTIYAMSIAATAVL